MQRFVWITVLAASTALGRPTITAYRAAVPPVIDGRVTEACWGKATVAGPFVDAKAEGLSREQTEVRLCWDRLHLYIAVEANEGLLDPKLNMLHRVKAEATGRDASIFAEDCVELFLQPSGAAYFHFGTNSGNGVYEGRGKASAWNCEWQVRTTRGATSYTAEIAIPFAALGGQPSGEWRANFTRSRPQAKELSTWCGLQGGFHQPEAFGVLRFAESGPTVSSVRLRMREGSLSAVTQLAAMGTDDRFSVTVTAGSAHEIASVATNGLQKLIVPVTEDLHGSTGVQAVCQLRREGTVLAESAPVSWRVSGGSVHWSVPTFEASVDAFLNGTPVSLIDGRAMVSLTSGTNVFALVGTADGKAPAMHPEVRVGQRSIPVRWAWRATTPPEGWCISVPEGVGWHGPATEGDGFWGTAGASRVWASTVICVPDGSKQLFPKTDRFDVPRGSTQLFRPYLHANNELPSEGYRMIVEAPAGLRYAALESMTSSVGADVSEAGEFTVGESTMKRYSLSWGDFPGRGMELSIRWGDRAGSLLLYEPAIESGGTHDWRHVTTELTAPKGAHSARPLIIKWQKRGTIGTFWVDNVVFRRKDRAENLLKMGTFDEPSWGRAFPAEGPDGSKCVKIVSTAEKADSQQACWVDAKDLVPVVEGQEYIVELDVKCDNVGSVSARPVLGLLFEAKAAMLEGTYPLFTYFQTLDGVVTELPQESVLRVLPPLRDVRPKHSRITPCYYGPKFRNPLVEAAFAENCWASGVTWTYGRVSNGVAERLLPRGHRVLLSVPWHAWSAPPGTHHLLEEHPDYKAIDFKGKPQRHIVCPTLMLSDAGKPFLDVLQDFLLEIVNSQPYFGANWDLEQPVVDPPTFCICPRCLGAFREQAGVPANIALNAAVILKTYRDAWTEFRCRQNAQMAGHMKRIFSQARRPIEFSMYSGYQCRRTREHYGVDWGLLAPHLDFAIAGYNGGRQQVYDTVTALDGIPFMGGEMWYLSERSDARPTPRMETWRNRLLRQYVESGCNGCLVWYLPPMDGGAFYATSQAAEIIAKHETLFREGTRCDSSLKVSGLPATGWAGFAKDDRVLILLMNFAAAPVTADVSQIDGPLKRTVELPGFGTEVLVVPGK
ncbi:MAG: hypothetical protein HN742_06585 [Lentisphaerae bacterium]|jgi:hypothetical protein|nr:hypothetical protein [Lentisphaerota bacterium]MBT4816655.1 hypothetical protein [Lentisphaerota bacterium]MBT5610074.1 hypothetical protein [Lentisphaerota bacterium]MBT7055526.1 hypothetical protein [Lentisphaerota bacterium]MBT7841519.1 hypothetical protein [Lentisphaerota bacterium]